MPLFIRGVVSAQDCTPLEGAALEVWQADADGHYDNDHGDPGPSVWVLRGTLTTDACGRYAFHTVKPGNYLNGNQYRPSHIHIRVTHPLTEELVTQLYFANDPYNAIDSMFKPSLAINLQPWEAFDVGDFNVVMKLKASNR